MENSISKTYASTQKKQNIRFSKPFSKTCGLDFFSLGVISHITSYALKEDDWLVLAFLGITGLGLAIYRLRQILLNGYESIIDNVFFTFILTFSLFFMFGPLLQVFGNIEEIEYSRHFFSITAESAVTVLGANLIGLGITLMVGRAFNFGYFINSTIKVFSRFPTFNMLFTSSVLVLVGLAFKAYVLYNDLFVHAIISGLYRIAQLLLPVGIFLYFKEYGFKKNLFLMFFLCSILLYSLGGLLEFNKTEVIIPILALTGGLLVRKITLPKLIVSITILGALMAFLQPINIDGRNEALRRFNPSLNQRIEIYQAAYRGELKNYNLANIGIWSRLDYTAPNAAAMWLYENGNGEESYKLIPWIFVPRFLYPDKPEMTGAGSKLTEKVLGFDTSSTGLGVFISGYYDLGWFGLIGVSILVGIMLAWYRAVIVASQISKSTILLIIGLSGHWMAIMVSGDYLSMYLGPMVTTLYLFYAFVFVHTIFLRK